MTFERALAADVVGMVAALALLFVMGLDWYSTTAGEEARRVERFTRPEGALGGEVPREVEERAREAAEGAETNAFQATGAIDRVILAGLVATVGLALAAGFMRAAGRRFQRPLTPSALAGGCACATALLVAFRMVQQPGLDAATTVKPGAALGVVALGTIALSSALAVGAEAAGTAWRRAASPTAPGAPESSGLSPPTDSEADDGRARGARRRGADERNVGGAPVEGGRPDE